MGVAAIGLQDSVSSAPSLRIACSKSSLSFAGLAASTICYCTVSPILFTVSLSLFCVSLVIHRLACCAHPLLRLGCAANVLTRCRCVLLLCTMPEQLTPHHQHCREKRQMKLDQSVSNLTMRPRPHSINSKGSRSPTADTRPRFWPF